MLIVILTYVLQLILIVHAIRNHKSFGWIWLLVFVPALGGVAYVIVEILPSLNVRNRGTKVMNAVFPARLVEAAARQYAVTPTPHNKRQLAEAYVAAGDTDRAIPLYQESQSNVGGEIDEEEIIALVASVRYGVRPGSHRCVENDLYRAAT